MIYLIWIIQCILALPFVLIGFFAEIAVVGFWSGRSFAEFVYKYCTKRVR